MHRLPKSVVDLGLYTSSGFLEGKSGERCFRVIVYLFSVSTKQLPQDTWLTFL
jgi:hypothetical protein